ncbi:MAG: carbon monoxide dehydrogenase subunit G [Anaerolineae bacterium]|nr:carbon monoxide dehydrogenase subunit G [Anaerolineae bacterium]
MEISGHYIFNVDQNTVWNILMNPDAIAKAIPGVREMTPIEGEENSYRALAKLNVAAVSGSYTGVIRMTEIDAPHQYRLTVTGEGQQSIISGSALIKLTPGEDDPTKTTVTWDAQGNLSGKLAGIAQRLVGMTASLLSRQFFSGLAKQLGDGNSPDEPVSPPAE